MIAIGSDHGGFHLKQEIMRHLADKGIEFHDYGTYSEESCDYPDFGEAVGRAVASGECERGIVICGTGIGISLAANKVRGVRAALALKIVDIFLETGFDGGRHSRRVAKLMDIEERN